MDAKAKLSPERWVHVLWSGGIDSTALIGLLLTNGHRVYAWWSDMADSIASAFAARESDARGAIMHEWRKKYGLDQLVIGALDAPTFVHFSDHRGEVPRRNRLWIDLLIHRLQRHFPTDHEIGLGEYIGCEDWLVTDHVGSADADARALSAYLYQEHGPDYRLWHMGSWGHETRFKIHRLALLRDFCGPTIMNLTTNCLNDSKLHCGICYKCIERSVAFQLLGLEDLTAYDANPWKHKQREQYLAQMRAGIAEGDVLL